MQNLLCRSEERSRGSVCWDHNSLLLDSFLTEWWRSLSPLIQNMQVFQSLHDFLSVITVSVCTKCAGITTLEDCDHELGLNEWNPQMKGRSYLSVSRLDTQQDKYQSCQHPAKSEFKVEERKTNKHRNSLHASRYISIQTYSYCKNSSARSVTQRSRKRERDYWPCTRAKPEATYFQKHGFSQRKHLDDPWIPSPLPSRALATPQLCAFTRKPTPGFH